MGNKKISIGQVCIWVSLLVVGGIAASLFSQSTEAASTLWNYQAGQEIKWHRVSGLGNPLLATDEAIVSLDPETGKVAWKRDDLKKIPDYAVEEIPNTPLLLVSANQGSSKTQLHAVDIVSGKDVWQTERLKGSAVGIVPVYEKNMVILLTSRNAMANKDKLDLIALDLATGDTKWESEFSDNVDLHAVEGAGKWMTKYDLSGQAPPVVDGDSVYFTYAGLHRFSLETGKLEYAVPYDVTEGRLKRANAQAVISGNTIYTSAKGVVRAHDKATGKIQWTSKDFGGAVAQLIVQGDLVYGRMGGQFYDYGKREWSLEKPMGVAAVSQKSGQTVWLYDKAQDSITNMLLLEGQSTLLVSDSKNLIGLDTGGEGKMKESFKIPLEFKNQIGGGAKAARAGMKFAKGGLIGMAKKSHDEDPPVAMTPRPNGGVVVRAKQHMLLFDPKTKQIPWSVEYEAPGVAGWEKIVMAAVTAAAYAYEYNQASHTQFGTSENWQANREKAQVVDNYQKMFEKRFSATKSGKQYVYILTNVEEDKDKGPGIVGVNMDTGEDEHQILLKTKEPNYVVDDDAGRVFLLGKDSKDLTAFSVKD